MRGGKNDALEWKLSVPPLMLSKKNLLVLGVRSNFYNTHLQVDKILLQNNSINN